MILQKVISGGQIGADQAGLFAARSCQIATGGWAPMGWATLEGPNLSLGHEFGLKEYTKQPGYPPRTFANVKASRGTIRFALNFNSPGELCTKRAIEHYKRPYLDIKYFSSDEVEKEKIIHDIVSWIRGREIEILNVAGNTPRHCGGIYDFTYDILVKVFGKLRE